MGGPFMRIRNYLILFAFSALAVFAASPAWAVCDPTTTAQTSCLAGPDITCNKVGTSTMDKGSKNIMACLYDDTGTMLIWKRMSGRVGTGPAWQSAQFYEDTEGYYVGAACPNGKVVTEIHTINVGMGGHNYWYIICK